eukprot:6190127-Prymnesium_polylepis.1
MVLQLWVRMELGEDGTAGVARPSADVAARHAETPVGTVQAMGRPRTVVRFPQAGVAAASACVARCALAAYDNMVARLVHRVAAAA